MELTGAQMDVITRALADPRRFAMLRQIAVGDSLPCTAIQEHNELSPATISHHLRELAEAQLIHTRREGRCLQMSLRRDVWEAYLRGLATAFAPGDTKL